MTSRIVLTSLLALSTGALFAAEPAAPNAGYTSKKRSSFAIPDSGRAPFWPIGWTPQREARAEAAPKVALDPAMFSVTSILLGNPSMAVINGRAYGEGETLRMPRLAKGEAVATKADSPRMTLPPGIRIHVQRIMDGRVVLQANAETVTVPLRRPELSERKPDADDQLLSLDER